MLRIPARFLAVSVMGAALLTVFGAAQNKPRINTAAILSYGNADAIAEDELKAYLYFLASDQLEGRNYPSRGYDTAALYVASHLAEWGLKPGGSASGTNGPLQPYFMPIELESRQVAPEESEAAVTAPSFVSVSAPPQTTSLKYGKDWFLGTPGSPAPPGTGFDVSGKYRVRR